MDVAAGGGSDLGADEAWSIMAANSNLPEHPEFPH